MADNELPSDFIRSAPARNLVQSMCRLCGTIFVSSDDLIPTLEAIHRQQCEEAKAGD